MTGGLNEAWKASGAPGSAASEKPLMAHVVIIALDHDEAHDLVAKTPKDVLEHITLLAVEKVDGAWKVLKDRFGVASKVLPLVHPKPEGTVIAQQLSDAMAATGTPNQLTTEVVGDVRVHTIAPLGPDVPSDQKPQLKGLIRDNPKTPEGKYLVKRRDGTVPAWPHFVLAAADPHAPAALRAYAGSISGDPDCDPVFASRLFKLADEFEQWRKDNHTGDPTRGLHRKDDPATVEEMKKGKSA